MGATSLLSLLLLEAALITDLKMSSNFEQVLESNQFDHFYFKEIGWMDCFSLGRMAVSVNHKIIQYLMEEVRPNFVQCWY